MSHDFISAQNNSVTSDHSRNTSSGEKNSLNGFSMRLDGHHLIITVSYYRCSLWHGAYESNNFLHRINKTIQ